MSLEDITKNIFKQADRAKKLEKVEVSSILLHRELVTKT